MSTKYIDLTQTFTDNMPVYPGDPPASLKPTASIEHEGYTDHQIISYMHVGTHMDSPLHMIPNGKTMDQIGLDKFFGTGFLINAKSVDVIDENLLNGLEIPSESIVLIYTGFAEKYWTDAYFENFPIMTQGFAERMVEKKIKIVGMDILGPDTDTAWPAHKVLLGNEVLIIENLSNLQALLNIKEFDVVALPAKYHAEAAPVRVIAIPHQGS